MNDKERKELVILRIYELLLRQQPFPYDDDWQYWNQIIIDSIGIRSFKNIKKESWKRLENYPEYVNHRYNLL